MYLVGAILLEIDVSKICNPVKGGMMGMGGNLMGKAVSKVSGKDEKKEEEDVQEAHHKPKFVKHLNKTRTMSAKQKWEWAFDKILTVSQIHSEYSCLQSLKAGGINLTGRARLVYRENRKAI